MWPGHKDQHKSRVMAPECMYLNGIGLVTQQGVQYCPKYQKDGPLLQREERCVGGLGVCAGTRRNMRLYWMKAQDEKSWYKRELEQREFFKDNLNFLRRVKHQDPLMTVTRPAFYLPHHWGYLNGRMQWFYKDAQGERRYFATRIQYGCVAHVKPLSASKVMPTADKPPS